MMQQEQPQQTVVELYDVRGNRTEQQFLQTFSYKDFGSVQVATEIYQNKQLKNKTEYAQEVVFYQDALCPGSTHFCRVFDVLQHSEGAMGLSVGGSFDLPLSGVLSSILPVWQTLMATTITNDPIVLHIAVLTNLHRTLQSVRTECSPFLVDNTTRQCSLKPLILR